MSERDPRDPNELLAAYVDGVGELTTDERKIVEAQLVEDPAWRAEANATRSLLGTLRDLPDEGREPDWSAMEHAIRAEVGPTVVRPWWRGWRWLAPIGALAMAGTVLLLVIRAPTTKPADDTATRTPAPREAPITAPDPEPTTLPLWLDGTAVEVDLRTADLLDEDPMPADDAELGLLPTDDLAWVDQLGDDDIAAAEAWLARKKS